MKKRINLLLISLLIVSMLVGCGERPSKEKSEDSSIESNSLSHDDVKDDGIERVSLDLSSNTFYGIDVIVAGDMIFCRPPSERYMDLKGDYHDYNVLAGTKVVLKGKEVNRRGTESETHKSDFLLYQDDYPANFSFKNSSWEYFDEEELIVYYYDVDGQHSWSLYEGENIVSLNIMTKEVDTLSISIPSKNETGKYLGIYKLEDNIILNFEKQSIQINLKSGEQTTYKQLNYNDENRDIPLKRIYNELKLYQKPIYGKSKAPVFIELTDGEVIKIAEHGARSWAFTNDTMYYVRNNIFENGMHHLGLVKVDVKRLAKEKQAYGFEYTGRNGKVYRSPGELMQKIQIDNKDNRLLTGRLYVRGNSIHLKVKGNIIAYDMKTKKLIDFGDNLSGLDIFHFDGKNLYDIGVRYETRVYKDEFGHYDDILEQFFK